VSWKVDEYRDKEKGVEVTRIAKTTKETQIKRTVKDYLNLKGIFHYHNMQGIASYKGLPISRRVLDRWHTIPCHKNLGRYKGGGRINGRDLLRFKEAKIKEVL